MSAAALKQVDRFAAHLSKREGGGVPFFNGWPRLMAADLRAVVALAKEAAELKRRISRALKDLECEDRGLGIFLAKEQLGSQRLPKRGRR
jgi:hypothetical protein